jgi:hypothetical protein
MFMMNCGIQGTAYGNWPDSRRGLEQAFGELCRTALPVVDDTRVAINGNLTVGLNSCGVFFSKNKATLVHCLRRIPLAGTITAASGQLAFVSHSYDWEKIGGWARNKIKGAKAWNDFHQTDRGENFIGRGGTKEKFITNQDRGRLFERGYYLCIANASDLRQHRDSLGVHGNGVSLANFANLVTGQVTREEAVNGLMDDLLIN